MKPKNPIIFCGKCRKLTKHKEEPGHLTIENQTVYLFRCMICGTARNMTKGDDK